MTEQEFYELTEPRGACILWFGARSAKGYGTLKVGGINFQAHRYIWELMKGTIPRGMLVCHTCDTPACVNVEHLFLGTNRDNIDDMLRKGRSRDSQGENNTRAKITEDDVREIRRLYSLGGVTQIELSKQFGLDSKGRSVSYIISRKTWTHVN